MIPVEGGGSTRCPAPQNGMMNNNKLPMDMNKNRYEKPVLTPPWGTEVATIEDRYSKRAGEVRGHFPIE